MIDTNKLTPEWLAGFFDGEGCVCIRRKRSWKAKFGWEMRINLTQANLPLLSQIAVLYKASYGPYQKTRKTKTSKESIVYEIGWYGEGAKYILDVLKDRAIVKSEQVVLALQFVGTMHSRFEKLDEATVQKRDEITEKLRWLNHAGPYKPASETSGVTH